MLSLLENEITLDKIPLVPRVTFKKLCQKESQVLALVDQRKTQTQIAKELGIGAGTVRTHLQATYDKLFY